MLYNFDDYGWYCGTGKKLRSTTVEPENKSMTVIDGEIRANWTGREWIDAKFFTANTTPSIEYTKYQLLDNIASHRYNIETGGLKINGTLIATDRESQILVTNLMMRAQIDNAFSVKFKAADGSILSVDNSMISAIYNAMFAFVQSCREKEAALIEQINAAQTYSELSLIDIYSGWPEAG